MNNKVSFSIFKMNLLIFQNPYEVFQFFDVIESTFFEEYWGYSRETVSLINRKIRECCVESCYKNIYKIRNIPFTFQYFETSFQKLTKSN